MRNVVIASSTGWLLIYTCTYIHYYLWNQNYIIIIIIIIMNYDISKEQKQRLSIGRRPAASQPVTILFKRAATALATIVSGRSSCSHCTRTSQPCVLSGGVAAAVINIYGHRLDLT